MARPLLACSNLIFWCCETRLASLPKLSADAAAPGTGGSCRAIAGFWGGLGFLLKVRSHPKRLLPWDWMVSVEASGVRDMAAESWGRKWGS